MGQTRCHQAEEPSGSPEFATVEKGLPADLYLGSKSHLQPPKQDHSHFGGCTEDGIKDMFCHWGCLFMYVLRACRSLRCQTHCV